MSSKKVDKRRTELPAVKTVKVDEQLLKWLNIIQDATGKTFSEILRDGVICRYPKITEAEVRYDKKIDSLKGDIIDLLGNEGDT